MTLSRFATGLSLALSLAVFAPACGGGSSGTTSGNPATLPGVGEHDSALISAAKGGSLQATGGEVVIPAGALAADTTVTIDIKDKSGYADAASIAVNVFDFGPNGTKFKKPVSLTLDLQGTTVPTGMTATLAYYDGSKWQPLADSKVAGGKVTATTTHFTPFTIVIVGGVQVGGSCPQFTPCGGDLTGTWTFTGACATLSASTLGGTWASCKTASIAASVDITGSVSFNADKSFSASGTLSLDATGTYPKTCLAAGAACSSLATGASPPTVTDSGADCTATQMQSQPITGSGTWASGGTQFTTTKAGGSPSAPNDYCVSGTTLTVQVPDSHGNVIRYVGTK